MPYIYYPKLKQRLLNFIFLKTSVTLQDVFREFGNISHGTIRKVLKQLENQGDIRTRYLLTDTRMKVISLIQEENLCI